MQGYHNTVMIAPHTNCYKTVSQQDFVYGRANRAAYNLVAWIGALQADGRFPTGITNTYESEVYVKSKS